MRGGLIFVGALLLIGTYLISNFLPVKTSQASEITTTEPYMYVFGGVILAAGLVVPSAKKSEIKDEALKRLKVRYAAGEITKGEYNRMLKDI